jgi:RNA polymerase sigma-70 factor (ECF subfamily)
MHAESGERTLRLALRRAAQTSGAAGDEPEEHLLVRRAQQSPRAFGPLYLRYRDAVINYCSYRLGDQFEAEDAASTVFVKALGSLRHFHDRDGSFRTWLFRIAHNEVVDRQRRRTRRPEAPIDLLRERPGGGPTPEDVAADTDAHLRVLALLTALPPRERAVLELRAAELRTEQIAAVLGISAQNVRSTQWRALARMRVLMANSAIPVTEVGRD